MSGNQKGNSGNSGQGASQARECNNGCGYDPSNSRHSESYWEGIKDPRSYPDSHMKFNSVYYRMIDRQIAENHYTECLKNPPTGSGQGNSKGASGGSK